MKDFIGKQMARFKFAQGYYTGIFGVITGISTAILALRLGTEWFFPLIITGIVLMFVVGYTVDKLGIVSADVEQTLKQMVVGSKHVNKIVWEEVIAPIEWKMLHKPIVDEIGKLREDVAELTQVLKERQR